MILPIEISSENVFPKISNTSCLFAWTNKQSGIAQIFSSMSSCLSLSNSSSNNILPLGSIAVILFCTHKHGWGWDRFTEEVNRGKGFGIGSWVKPYMTWILPAIVSVVYLKGYYDYFSGKSIPLMIIWMTIAVILLGIILFFTLPKKNKPAKK